MQSSTNLIIYKVLVLIKAVRPKQKAIRYTDQITH